MLNLLFGFRCMINALRGLSETNAGGAFLAAGYFEGAARMLFIAAIFDTFDGLIARGLSATSEFGKEYDSLADVVTFGAAPAVLLFAWGLHILGNLGAGIAFMFLAAVSLRLARFNVNTGKSDHRYFVGLPSPAGALTIAAIINFAPDPLQPMDQRYAMIMAGLTVAVAFAMVSPIRYRSQKGLNLNKERPLMAFLIFALIVGLAMRWTREFLLTFTLLYLISGPVARVFGMIFPSRRPPAPAEPAKPADESAVPSPS